MDLVACQPHKEFSILVSLHVRQLYGVMDPEQESLPHDKLAGVAVDHVAKSAAVRREYRYANPNIPLVSKVFCFHRSYLPATPRM